MKKKTILVTLAAVMCINMLGCGNVKAPDYELKMTVTDSPAIIDTKEMKKEVDYKKLLNQFGLDLITKSMDEKNPVLSPLSAYLALHLTAEGAKENTLAELTSVLGSIETQRQVADIAQGLTKNSDSMCFSLKDSAWIDDEFTVSEEWINKALAYDIDQAFYMNLAGEKAMNEMNKWVKESTNGMIEKMIEKPLPELTRLVLFNSLYMKGKWENEFLKADTDKYAFDIKDGLIKNVDMMALYDTHLDYINSNELEGVVLPYKDSSLAFIALKAKDEKADIRESIEELDADTLLQMIRDRYNRNMNVKLPSFELAFEKELNDPLIEMGIHDAFDENRSNFRGIGTTDSGNDIYISLIKQKAKIKVNEEGTEAAAVTEVIMVECTAFVEPEEVYEIVFDREFFYIIMDMENEIPVFLGFLDDPTAK